MFKVGDTVCYIQSEGEQKTILQGIVLEVKEHIKISYHYNDEQEIIWVDSSEIELINTSRCSHNAECGWCDDTGECIYK